MSNFSHFVKVKHCVKVVTHNGKKEEIVNVYPSYFITGNDIMRKGGKFYAVLNRDTSMWVTDESFMYKLIDDDISCYVKDNFQNADGKYYDNYGRPVHAEYLNDSSTNRLREFNVWFSNLPDNHNYRQLDTEITWLSTKVTPDMYRSHRLLYDVKNGKCEAYEKIVSTLYSDDDRRKLEWAIGAVISGESKMTEKMVVLYGAPGSGKSTILDLLKDLFDGYYAPFKISDIISSTKQFATAMFKDNPHVAIDDDASMAKIESPVINEIISHKEIIVNEKKKSQYTIKSNAMLFIATNDPVDIHSTQLGITRRLLDVYPSGNKIPPDEYLLLVSKLKFELGSIAAHCLSVYESMGRMYYLSYVPEEMIHKTNYIRNFLFDSLNELQKKTVFIRNDLYIMYKNYCEESGIRPIQRISFTEELREYFNEYSHIKWVGDKSIRHVYTGLKIEKICGVKGLPEKPDEVPDWLKFNETESVLDKLYSKCPAQMAVEGGERDGLPERSWDKCKTHLCDINVHKLHWFKLPPSVIKIDFDKKDQDGNKSLLENIKAAKGFPSTYGELSKSGEGIHLYYIYDGDVSKVSRIFDENIEIKIDCPHRRILTRCNNLPLATITTGLPLKEEKPKIENVPISVKGLRTTIKRCLAKEIHADTTSNVDWIYEILERAYESGLKYDVSDMKDEIYAFASNSSHQAERCKNKVAQMKFRSKSSEEEDESTNADQVKGGTPVIDSIATEDEINVRNAVLSILRQGDSTTARTTIDGIYDILETAQNAGMIYDISDIEQTLLIFAMNANKDDKDYCIKKLDELPLVTEEAGEYDNGYRDDDPIIFFDYEVFPNLIVLCWKYAGEDKPVFKMINPTSEDVANVFGIGKERKPKAIGFNNKDYDNHITYAIYIGKTIYEVYLISKAIIGKDKGAKFREARNLSYTDVFDFLPEKISLKKWEIRLGITHQELSFKWDEPIDEKYWSVVTGYCANDVLATEAVFNKNRAAFKGRLILVDLANILMGPGSVPNDSTNDLTTKLIVGNERHPQQYFVYPDLSEEFPGYEFDKNGIDKSRYISKDVIISGKSFYKGYDPGEGGFVWAKPGMYGFCESDDSASHHPSTIIAKNGFGKFTPNFKRLLDLRLMVKHKEYDKLRHLYNGALAKYLESDEDAKALSFALKIAINSVYGLTAAKFPHPLHDERNIDNWVAKRGALFMIDLMLNVQEMGYTVIHCKTDSIKILNPDDKVRQYIYDFGKKYGYTFEVEHRFDRLCLVNDSVYVCKYTDEDVNEDMRGQWDATGKQFQVPYVFKMLFSHEPIEFKDVCETKNVSTALYLDFNEKLPEGEHDYRFVGKTGQFSPVKPGTGGGILYREKDGLYYAAESTTGYRWLESEEVKMLGKEADIDETFYKKQVDKAVDTISKFGDFNSFVSEGKYVDMSFMNIPEESEDGIPWN